MAFSGYNYGYNQNMNYTPLIFVNGLDGAKSYIISGFNQIVYLKDTESDLLFIKSSDAMGKLYLKAYKLNEVNIDEISGVKQPNQSFFVSQEVFNKTIGDLENKLNKMLDILTPAQKGKESKDVSK